MRVRHRRKVPTGAIHGDSLGTRMAFALVSAPALAVARTFALALASSSAFAAAPRALPAQFPRIVPPPPCVIPAAERVRSTARASGDRRPFLLIESLDATATERRSLHVPYAVAERLRERLRRDARLAVATDGSAERALYEAGGSPDSAATLLGADWIVRGRSRSSADGTELSVSLLKRGTASPVWTGSYRVPAQPLSTVESAIARAVTTAVRGSGSKAAPRARGAPRLADADALLARADLLMHEPGLASADSARELLERALKVDTSSALIAVQLARAYLLVLERGGTTPPISPPNALRRVDELTAFALRRDARRSDAHTLRGVAARLRDTLDLAGAIAAHNKAIVIAPGDAEALHGRGVTWLALGDTERAVADFRRALAAEPERGATLAELATIELRAGRYNAACAYSNAAIAAEPFGAHAYAVRAQARLRLGQARDAFADSETASRLSSDPWTVGLQLLIEAGVGNRERSAALVRTITQRYLAPGSGLAVYDAVMLAAGYLAAGDRKLALEALSRARPRGRLLASALRDSAFAPVRGDSLFKALSAVPRPRQAQR